MGRGGTRTRAYDRDFDDTADRELFPSVYGWVDDDLSHASAVMLPDGRVFGRVVGPEGEFTPLASVAMAGEEVRFWYPHDHLAAVPEFALRHAQAFGGGSGCLPGSASCSGLHWDGVFG